MKYDKAYNIRNLFVLNQDKLKPSTILIKGISNICENIKKIYQHYLLSDNQAEDEYYVFVAISDLNYEAFSRFLRAIANPEEGINPLAKQKLVDALSYVYKAVHGSLSLSELLGSSINIETIDQSDKDKIVMVLQEIFETHLEKLISEAEKKLTPEEKEVKAQRTDKHIKRLLQETHNEQLEHL